jgi:hypothetical protein
MDYELNRIKKLAVHDSEISGIMGLGRILTA